MQLTFEQLPAAISMVLDRLENVERLLQRKGSATQAGQDKLMTIDEAAAFLHLSKATIYGLVSKRKIPVIKKPGGKRLYFSTQALTKWLSDSNREAVL